jgi:hypothetical protein
MPPYEFLSKPLANIYERGIGRIPTMPSIGVPPLAAKTQVPQEPRLEEGKMTQARMDLYASIHKGLRSFMADTLGAVGRMDADDAEERDATLAQLRSLLDLLEHHANIEDRFIHVAMQSRRPGSAQESGAEHERQRGVLHDLRRQADVIESGGRPRAVAALELYRHLSLFVAENLGHMHEEETVNGAVLWAEFSDEELAAIHDRIIASIDAREMAQVIRWMAPSLTPCERTALFGALQAKAPAEVFHRLLEAARPHLAPRDWNKLIFGIAAAPLAA